MKTMKRLLALLLALSMVMPNCLTIASAYDEEIVEEVVEELVEEIVETPEEVVEEVFEEVYEEEIYEEEIQEEVSEQVAEEVVEEVSSLSSSAEVANTEVPSELETLSWSDPDAEDDSEEQFAAYANGILFPHQPAAVGTAGKDALPADSNALELYEALAGPIKKIADGETNSSIVTVTLTKALDQTGLDNAITALLMDMPFNLYWYDKVRGLSVGISGDQYTFYFRVAKYYATEDITEVNFSDNKTFSGYTTTKQELTGAANAAAQKAWTVATQTAFAEYSGGSCDTPYDRLMAYIEWIEGAVSYDYDALIDPAEFSVGDCNPWQIIYTFDGNPNTNVVCEGYSKSLQYLCEYAASQEIVVPEVFSVTGDSRDTTRDGGGRHMWNIAVLDGKNYLVDVTNADGGWNSILRGVPAVNGSYTYFATDSNGNPITENNILQHTVTLTAGNESIEMLYAYDPETMELFGEHLPKLTLAETDYVPGEEKPEGETPEAPEVNEYPVTTQAALLTALANAKPGDAVIVEGNLSLDQNVNITIPQGVILNIKYDASLTNNGHMENMGNLYVSKENEQGATLINNGTISNYGAMVATDTSTLVNNGILENRDNGDLSIFGTYEHHGELKLYTRMTEAGLKVNDIRGGVVDNGIISVITETTDLMTMDQGFTFAEHYGQAQVHMKGNPNFIQGLYLGHNWDLHIYGNAVIGGGDVVVECGQLQVEPGASLTTNDELVLLGGARVKAHPGAQLVTNDAVWINGGSRIDNAGSWTANKAIHVGYQNKGNVPVSGVLNVGGMLSANDYVNICKDAQLNISGTMTQMPYDEETELGGVIIENHGLLNIEGGTLNQNHDICNYGEMIVSGGLNILSGNLMNENGGAMTIAGTAALSFKDGGICVWNGGSLTNNGAELPDRINVTPLKAAVSGVENKDIYATYFVNTEDELAAAIADVQEKGYGFNEIMPMSTIRLNKDVTIPANTILQLWDHNNQGVNVIVSNQVKLTTEENENGAGGIIINPECRLIVEQGGMLVNNGSVDVTNNTRGREGLTPGILWYYDNGSIEGEWPDTGNGGILSKGTMTQEELEAAWKSANEDEDSCGWMHEAVTTLTGDLTLSGKDFYLDDYGTIVVPSGKKLIINNYFKVIGGKIIVEDGGYLENNGTLEILEGSVYIAKGGDASDGDYRGYMTWEEGEDHSGTTAYLSTYWVHNFGEGAFVNHDYQENRGFRMVPGEKYSWIFYYNEWDPSNLSWSRIPVHPDDLSEGDYVTIEPASNYEWLAEARPDYEDLKDYFVMVSIDDVEEAWNKGTVVRYQYGEGENEYVDYGIDICRDSDRGFYKEADATDGNWLFEVQTAPIFAEEDGTKSLYFIYTREDHTISNVALNTEDTFATLTPVEGKANIWKITLSKDYVDSLWKHNVERDDHLEVTYTETNSNGDFWPNSVDIGIQAIWPTTEAGFTLIDKNDVFEGYNYDAETGKWIDSYDGGWRIIEGLPEGITYDYATNTLTLNNAQLNGMHLYYRGENGETYLPNPNLTIHLVGESSIVNHGIGQSLIIGSGVKATITGDGVLNLGSTNAGSINTAIDVTPESTLTLDGGTININNANLMLGGVVTINGATVNTTNGQVNVNNRLDLKTGALNVTALGNVAEHNERPGEMHTHYDAINVGWGNLLRVAGGELKVIIPAPTTESAWFRGIHSNAGNVVIDGGTVTFDTPDGVSGNAINLDVAHDEHENVIENTKSTFVMNGGKLVMKEAIFSDYGMANVLWGEGNAVVEINGGEMDLDAVIFEVNGKTTWNNGTVNGEEVRFLAGGPEFVINGGTFNLTGKAIPNNEEIFSNALFRAGGNVVMNGGNVNIVDGILAAINSFALNGGTVTINNRYDEMVGVGVSNNMSINGGVLNVTVPGGSAEVPQRDEEGNIVKDEEGNPVTYTEVYPAMWVYGTLHQMGGTVNVTSTTTAAVRSEGSVLLNGGTLNLSGTYGIGQFGEGKFEASGGELNITATDTGIYAKDSTVRFVPGTDIASDPIVKIQATPAQGQKAGAIQLFTSTEDSKFENAYTFVNANGEPLEMSTYDGRSEEAYLNSYVHTLKDGENYALYAEIKEVSEIIDSQEKLNALVAGAPNNTFRSARDVTITGDVTISNLHFHMIHDAVMTIESGATVTIQQTGPENTALVAQNSAKIIVEDGAKIINKGILAVDTGTIQFADADCYEAPANANGIVVGVLRKHYRHGSWGTVTSTDEENPESPVGTELQTVIADISSNDQLWNVTAELNKGYAAGSININGDMTIANGTTTLPANTMLFADNGTLTIAEGGTLTIGKDAQLTSNAGLDLIVNGTLNVNTPDGLWLWGSNVTVGESGTLNVNADLSVMNNTQLNVMGNLVNNAALFVQGSNLNIGRNGKLINNGSLDILERNTNQNNQLNVMGQLINNPNGVITNNALILVSGALNIDGGEMRQNHTLMISGSANIRGKLDTRGRTVLEGGDDFGATMIVGPGGSVELIHMGKFLVQSGAALYNGKDDIGNGNVQIVMGTLYVEEGGKYEGPHNGEITDPDSDTKTHLSAYWAGHNEEDGWHVQPEHGTMREMRMVPGGEYYIAVYRNEWISEPENGEYYWNRSPAYLVLEGYEHLNLQPLTEGMLKVTVNDNAWGNAVDLKMENDEKLTFPIYIGTDSTHGFYKAAAASNENWLEDITVNNLAENPADMVVYFLLTDADKVMTGEHWLDLPEDVVVNTEYQNDGKTIKVTIPGSTIKSLGQGFWMNMNYKVQPVNGGDEEHWSYGIQVNRIEPHQLQRNAWMRINGRDYSYNKANDVWMLEGQIVTLPNMSYDYASNTLTMNGADLTGLEVSCYGVDEETNELNGTCEALPDPNLTLVLKGENKIQSNRDTALRISTGVKLNITGDGSLYLLTDNGTGITNEEGTEVWSCPTVHMVNDETLTISGNARVTVEVKGKKAGDHVSAVQGASALTVKDNAVLTTILPENGNRYDDINRTGGYSGLNDFRSIHIQGGTVNTQFIGTNRYTQTGGTVNIKPLPELMMTDNWQWDEQKQENVNLGKVSNTNFDGLYTNGGTVTISGGALNITIPNVTITTDRSNYRGIGMDGGELTINGGVITIDAPAGRMGNGINLGRSWDEETQTNVGNTVFNMNGGRVVMKEAVFGDNYDMTNFLFGDGYAEVYVNGGVWDLDSVIIDLNGKTEWNNAVVNGEETIFMAGGSEFIINSGEINLTGKPLANETEIYSNALFRAHGMVTMNGGEINIENGILGVPTGFELNGGNINIHNDEFENVYGGLYVGKYMAINGGTLTLHTIGGQETITENGKTWIADYPAVYIDGTLHQMGGTVNITNTDDGDFSAAIKSFGNVILNDGTMNLEGNYGVEIYGNGNYGQNVEAAAEGEEGGTEQTPSNTMFFADGGVLNIDARDSGILSRHSSIRFVTGKNGEIPEVNIHSGAGALQLLTDANTPSYSAAYINEYSFVNTNGSKLVMKSELHEEPGAEDCYIHTLMDGNYYATNAILKDVVTKTETEFWNDVENAGDVFQLTYDVTITSNATLNKRVEVMNGAELIVAPGAVLTLQNPGSLAAVHGGKITVQAEGQIYNESAQLTNFMGTITIYHGKDKMGYVENQKGQMHMQTYSQNGELLTGTTIGWPNASQTLDVTCENLDQYERAIGITASRGYGGTFVDFYNDIDMNRYVTIPKNVTVSINNPHNLENGTVNTGSEVSIFTVKAGQTLTINGALFINNGAKMVVETGAILHYNEGGLHIGEWQNGNFATSGTLDVYGTANLKGYTAIHNFAMEKVVDGQKKLVNLPGVMNVYGTVNTSAEGESAPGGYLQNFGVLNVESGGVINSNFLFDTIGTTNVKSGAAVTLTNGMMVTGVLDVAGALTNEKGTLHVGTFDENGNLVPGTVNVTGTLTNKGNVSMVHQMTVSGVLNNVGSIFLDSNAAALTATGTVINAGSIDPQMRSGTIDFSAADYQQKDQGELIVDYGATFNTAVRDADKGEVTLRYAGSDLETAQTVKALATEQGYRDFLWAVTADVTIPATAKGETAVTVAAGDRLVVAPGVTLTIDGELNNAGSLMLAKRGGSDLAGALVISEKAKITNAGSITTAENSTLTNNGTIEMHPIAVLKVNGSYEAGTNSAVRMELDTATVTGIDTKELTVIKKIQEPANALTELNAALAYDSTSYKAMEILMTAIVETTDNRGLEITGDLVTIAENKELIIGTEGAAKQPVVTFTGNVVNKGILTNYGDVFIGDLVNDGTVNNYGTLCAGGAYSGVCGPNLTWKLGANANVFARTVVPTALVISGSGEMTSTPWNDKVPADTLQTVTTIKLSNQLTNILDGAFVNFTGVKTITIPKSVVNDEDERHVTRAAFAENSTNLTLMIYHTFDKTSVTGITREFIHELVEGECRYCDYTTAKLAEDVTTAAGKAAEEQNADAVVAVLNTMDTAALKQQVESEMSSGATTVINAIKQADTVVQEQNNVTVSKDDNSQHVTITANPEGAALSAKQKNSEVTLVVNDVAAAPEPEQAPAEYKTHAAEDAIAVDMTLTGVDDPENLTAPVTITLDNPFVNAVKKKFAIVHHSVNGAEAVKYKLSEDNKTVTFTVDSFSVFEILPSAVAYVQVDTRTHAELINAIEAAAPGETVTLLESYEGEPITIHKNLFINPNSFTIADEDIVPAVGFAKRTISGGCIEIYTVEAQLGDVKYETLDAAITEAETAENAEITLLRSVTTPVTVPKPMTIHKGSDFTAVIKAAVGLAVTETETDYVIGTAVAQLKGVNYGSFDTALAAAQDGDTITLCQNVDGTYQTKKQITVVPGDYADGFVLKAEPGYVAVDNGWRIVKAKAQIGEVYYATLADAMKFAANADQMVTITMLDNDAEPCAVTVPVIIEEVDKYSINLTLAEDLVQSKTDGTLTIGTAEATVGGKGYATLEAALEDAVNGTVTLQKNIVREYPVQVTDKVTIITKGNTVKLTAIAELACITTNSGYQFVPAAAKAGNTGYVTLEAALSAVKNAEDKTITLLQKIKEATVIKQEVTIDKNGKTADLSTTSDFIHTANGDVHTFVMAKARIGEINYASLKAALAAAQENDTITLLAAPAAEEKIAQNVKIDLNGVMETVPVADGWEAVKDEDGSWTVQKKPALTGSIMLHTVTLNLQDKVAIIYKTTDDHIPTDNANVAERGVLLYKSREDAETKDMSKAYETIMLEWNEADKKYVGQSEGIDARDMDLSQFAVAYLKMNDGSYIMGTYKGEYDILEYSPLIYCKRKKNDGKVGTLCAALMHYGAAAQVAQYGYTTGLMNDGFAEVPYDANVLGDSVFELDFTEYNGILINSVSMDLRGAISYIIKCDVEAAAQGKQLYAEYELLGKTGSVKMVAGEGNRMNAKIAGVFPKDLDSALTIKPYYLDDAGEKVYGDKLVYSGYEYVRRALNNTGYTEDVKELSKALAMYIHYADIYSGGK